MSRRAEKIGSLLFCPDCGTLLDLPRDDQNEVLCEQCGHAEPASSYENIEIITRSHPDAFPSALRQKSKTQTKTHNSEDALLKVTEKCPNCGHMEAFSKEMQLRSADEGSTILYTCIACRHGWRVNN
ncbi:DNA-directed RNA polymerase I kDa polypeptide [Trametopsis cervina]|nr:DNA-directed RNA polymerase I kDa polypeptide [Trametopsis cervina]